ncbi:hypothetical protein ACOSQ3_014267 [Xanthoceras sorbifolium]
MYVLNSMLMMFYVPFQEAVAEQLEPSAIEVGKPYYEGLMDVDDLFPEGDDIPGSGGRSESGDIPEGNDGAVGTDDADTPRDIPGANINTGRGQDHAASGCTNKSPHRTQDDTYAPEYTQ